MQIYIETANVDEVREAMQWCVVDGVVTDPGMIARETGEATDLLLELLELVPGPVSVEVTGPDTAAMVEEALALAALHDRLVVRVPCVPAGIPAIAELAGQRLTLDASLCFSVPQALLAAKAGARIISPQVSTMDEAGGDGLTLVSSILTMLDQYDLKTGVIATSLDHPVHFSEVARMGVDAASVSLELLRRLSEHPLSESLRAQRLKSWRAGQN